VIADASLRFPMVMLAEVRDAAGHSNVTITSGYLHVAVEESGVGALFA
jgi:hypothetical protein